MRRFGLLFSIVLPVLLSALASGCGFGERSDILLVVRAEDAVSRAIADAYASARNVPENRILELKLSMSPGTIEIDAETYLREIAAPIERHLESEDPDADISILITTRGLPLRIGHCDSSAPGYPRNCQSAAVDAALAQLGRTGDEGLAFVRVENPFFRDPRRFERFREDTPDGALRFLVARLSAMPSPKDSPGAPPRALLDMLDRAPMPSATPPLWQVVSENLRSDRTAAAAALLDSIEDQLPRLGHRVCDPCATTGSDQRATGIVLHSGAQGGTAEPAGGRLAYPGLVIGLDGTRADRGRESESPFDRFVTHWLERGAGAISTHLAGPSLPDVTRPTAQLSSLARGSSTIEAHFKSVPQLGWVNVFIGDPLLRLDDEALADDGARDQDRDGVADAEDNCRADPNADQRDTNADGLGNVCDPDVNDDGRVITSWGMIYPVDRRGDLEIISLTARNGPYDEHHDLDGDGRVDERDLARAQLWLFRTPGR
jgi:hypothetical protein